MKNPILFFPIMVFMLLLLSACNDNDDDQPQPTPIATAADLTAQLNDIYNNSKAPGFAFTIVKDDAIIYQEAFGKADYSSGKDFTNQTIQPIGSISKTFVAAAIVKAIEQGHFDLETDINDILPINLINPKRPNDIIKVKHLVTHTSGLLDEDDTYDQAYWILPGEDLSTPGAKLLMEELGIQKRPGLELGDFLAEYYLEGGGGYSPNNFAAVQPGTQWNYSNIATSLAAYLVEAATGEDFRDYVRTQILQPLQMYNSAYDLDNLNADLLATIYFDKNTPLPYYSNDSYPDGSLNTNNEDLSKFLLDMMKGAKGESEALFSKEGYAMLFNPLLPNGITPAALGDNQGVFWILNQGDISHGGSDPGISTEMQFSGDGRVGFLMLSTMDASTDEHEEEYVAFATQALTAVIEFIQAQ